MVSMRLTLLCLLLFSGGLAVAQTLTTDRDKVVRSGAAEVAFPDVPEHALTSLSLKGVTIHFSIPLTRQDVPAGWSYWQKGLSPKILESPDGAAVTLTFSKPLAAFGVELMPVWKKGRDMQLQILKPNGKVLTQFVKIDPGARFFGFTGGRVTAVKLSKLPFDEGSFGLGRMLYSIVK
jgi:hypothetical protein